jgi:hypothetical protein
MYYLCSLWLFPWCPTHCSVFVFLFCLSSSSVPHICCEEEFELTKGVIKIRKSKKDRQTLNHFEIKLSHHAHVLHIVLCLCFCFVCLRLLYPISVASFSLFIFDCHFDINNRELRM